MKRDLSDLKEKQLILIEGKNFEVVGIQGEGREHEKTGKVRNCKNYIIHEIESKTLWPISLTYCKDTKKSYWGFTNKEVKLSDIKIL